MKELLEKFVKKPLDFIDSGELFKKGFFFIFKLLAILVVGFGLYTLVVGIGPHFNRILQMDGFFIVRSILVFIITLVISLGCFVALGLIFWKNGDDFKDTPYSGLALIVAKVLKIVGQMAAVLYGALGINIFISTLFSGTPFGLSFSTIANVLPPNPLTMFMQANYMAQDIGQYFENLLGGVIALVVSIVVMFVVLAVFYLLAELYEIILSFLLRKKVFKD